jgi:hypothetical protein
MRFLKRLQDALLDVGSDLGFKPSTRIFAQEKLNRPAAHLAIFNVLSTHVFRVQQHLYRLATVRTINTALLQSGSGHGGLAGLLKHCCLGQRVRALKH